MNRAEDLLVLEHVAGQRRAVVRAYAELGEVRPSGPCTSSSRTNCAPISPLQPEPAVRDRQLDRLRRKPIAPRTRRRSFPRRRWGDEPLAAGQVAERARGRAGRRPRSRRREIESEVGPARARDVRLAPWSSSDATAAHAGERVEVDSSARASPVTQAGPPRAPRRSPACALRCARGTRGGCDEESAAASAARSAAAFGPCVARSSMSVSTGRRNGGRFGRRPRRARACRSAITSTLGGLHSEQRRTDCLTAASRARGKDTSVGLM